MREVTCRINRNKTVEQYLLKTKLLIPPIHRSLVNRERLIEQLDQGLAGKLTLVSAPAGYGKTTLLSEWANRCRMPVAWLSLDAGDNDPARFIPYFRSALATVEASFDGDGLTEIIHAKDAGIDALRLSEELQILLLNQIYSISSDFVLVLDDYHLITNHSIHRFLAFLVEHLPPQMHLVISARADPSLPLALLRARSELCELRAAELRFSEQESADFISRVMGIELNAGDISALAQRTEGWAAGLQLAAVTMKEQDDRSGFIEAFTGSSRYILDYLLEEVLERQPVQVQEFLLNTSILESMCGPLCDALLGEKRGLSSVETGNSKAVIWYTSSQSILNHLEATNLFVIPLDDRREWYRYHRLFADILQKQLTLQHPDRTPGLHIRASEWYLQSGKFADAIEHSLAAGDVSRSASLIERHAETALMRGEMATILGWFDRLPEGSLQDYPYLDLISAACQIFSGYSQEIIYPLLERAERDLTQYGRELAVLRAYLAIYEMNYKLAEELAMQALETFSTGMSFFPSAAEWVVSICRVNDDDYRQRAEVLESLVRKSQSMGSQWFMVGSISRLADVRMNMGETHLALDLYKQAISIGTTRDGSLLPIAGVALTGLGQLMVEWYELDQAVQYLEQGIAMNKLWHPFAVLEGYTSLALCNDLQGDTQGAWQSVQRARQVATAFDVTQIDDRVVAMTEARLKLRQGDKQAFFRYMEQERAEHPSPSLFDARIRKYEQMFLAQTHLALDQPEEALELIEDLLPVMEKNNRTLILVELEILRSMTFTAQGRASSAQEAIENALVLAAPAGFIRLFVEQGQALIAPLKSALEREVCPEFTASLLRILDGDHRTPISQDIQWQEGLVEPLSERELQVLGYLNSSLTVPEIAEELYISDSTVRSHVKSIYGKFGVHRRLDAIKRGEELGLLTGMSDD